MYNETRLKTIAVVVQQAKKKPLVTELLAERCYRRGWRCELNYDQYCQLGQVFSYHRHKLTENGDDLY